MIKYTNPLIMFNWQFGFLVEIQKTALKDRWYICFELPLISITIYLWRIK